MRRALPFLVAIGIVAAVVVPYLALGGGSFEPTPVADPCEPRELPSTGGIGGIAQDAGLAGLDRAACEFGSSREELAIALVDDAAAEEYESEHGVDPRSIGTLVGGALGL